MTDASRASDDLVERDYLAEFDLASAKSRDILYQAGREVNYFRTLLRELRPYIQADHPWLVGIDEQISLISWQPIETAPTDSGAFLVFCPDHGNTYCVYRKAHYYGDAFRMFGGDATLNETPSHWMHLPRNPS